MTIEVEAPDGSVVEFPDNMDEPAIHQAMLKQFGDTPQKRIAQDFANLPPTRFGQPMGEREVPEPPSLGSVNLGSIRDTLRKSSDITQRARNTALGTGPGSVGGIPGVALVPAIEPVATMVAKSAAAAAKQLPATALAATAGYVASNFGEQPEWLKEFIHNLLLHVQLSAGSKK